MISIKKSKKGISETLSTVLIISVTLAAVILLWQIIVPYVQERLDKGSECLNYDIGYFQFEEKIDSSTGVKKFNCFSRVNPNIFAGASISAKSVDQNVLEQVKGFNLILNKDDGSSTVYTIRKNEILDSTKWMYKKKSGQFEIPINGEVLTYIVSENTDKDYISAAVYPVLNSGKICAKTDEISIVPCASNLDLNS